MSEKRSEYVVVIAQKALKAAKTRLSSVLDKEARTSLAFELLRRTLEVCSQLDDAAAMFVCGPEEVASMAREFGAELIPGGSGGLRRDMTLAAEDWRIAGRAAMLVVSSDLPLATPDELRRVVEAWRRCADVVLCPDRRQRGTNVMMVNAPEKFHFAFGSVVGPGSFEIHLSQAQGTGLSVEIIRSEKLALDIDLPEDLAYFVHIAPDDPLARYASAHLREDVQYQ